MALNRFNARWLQAVFAMLALSALAVLGGCGGGSGAPNNPYAKKPAPPGPILILPASISVYSNTPATLTVTGGVPPYFVVSSNPTLLPLGSSSSTGTIVLLPTNIPAVQSVIVTVTDTVGSQATATVTVNPAPIFNTLTVTPASATCGANTICSGQTATAAVTVTGPGGAGIAGRQVRFDVVAGAFAIQNPDPANPLVATRTVVSDQFGHAQVIIQANVEAPTQPALLRATEITTGEQQTAQFTIVQTINGSAVLSVVPSTATITGPDSATCSAGVAVSYYIYGGTPPYNVAASFPTAVGLFGVPVPAPGSAFTAVTNSTCFDPLTFTIVDATGLQTTATLSNKPGTAAPPVPPPAPLDAEPASQMVAACLGKTISVQITGGVAPYSVSSSNAGLVISPSPLAAPGFVHISGFAASPPTAVYTFIASDSSTPKLTAGFSITCM